MTKERTRYLAIPDTDELPFSLDIMKTVEKVFETDRDIGMFAWDFELINVT